MLIHPKSKEQELKELASVTIEEKYKYYHIGYFSLPLVEDDEWNKIQRISLYNEKVIGYFCGNINRANGIISNVSTFSVAKTFEEYRAFEKDLLRFFLLLLNQYPTIQWTCCYDNPVRKKYEKFCNYIGGNIVGVYHQSARVGGELLNEEAFEVISTEDVKQKIQKLINRFFR